ncbi:MAG TPA: YqgE/AlgH family protein [Tepidisphaeraceae bacterium]|jgi:putative transcriptional regulator|nr:YqgE/AlgH family protein [Tepidisphaeraceae bacterium]
MKSLQGKLLIASPALEDPNFSKAVVLLVRHDEEGALGVIINRPLETTVMEAVGDAVDVPFVVEGSLYQGGPCEGPLMVMHTQEEAGEMRVADGMYFSVERDKVEWLLKNEEGLARYFVGYSGWGEGQLEAEMETGSWLLVEGGDEVVFGEVEELWPRLMLAATVGKWIKPGLMPGDPSSN